MWCAGCPANRISYGQFHEYSNNGGTNRVAVELAKRHDCDVSGIEQHNQWLTGSGREKSFGCLDRGGGATTREEVFVPEKLRADYAFPQRAKKEGAWAGRLPQNFWTTTASSKSHQTARRRATVQLEPTTWCEASSHGPSGQLPKACSMHPVHEACE